MRRACPHNYDFSTLYTTLPHNLIKEKLLDLIEWTFKRALKNYGSLYLACNDRKANGFVSSKIYDKRNAFDIVNFPFLDGDVPRHASYGVYISQLIRFARVCNHVTDFNARNKFLMAKLLQQGYRYHKKVQVGKDQEKAQSEKDSHSKNRGGKKPNQQSGTYTMKHIVSRMSSYFPNRWPLSYLNLTKNMKTYINFEKPFLNFIVDTMN